MSQPHSLIDAQGKPQFGLFTGPVSEVNIADADYRTPMNKKAGRWKRYFNFKRFQYFGGMGKDLIFGCALADLRYLGAVFVYVYRISDGKMLTWQYKTPLAIGLNLTNRPNKGVSTFKKGQRLIQMRYQLNSPGERKKILEVNFGTELSIKAEMHESKGFQTMALCTPAAVNGWVYAQKTAALPVTGTVNCELGEFTLDHTQCYGHHDYSAGYMRRETFWNWACFSGQEGDTLPLGLNVSWGVNETGYSENCFWVGNTLHALPQVQFKFDRDDDQSKWQITSQSEQLSLEFTPEGMHREHLNAGFMATNFKQIFGRFNGHVQTVDGQRFHVKNMVGFVEDQYSKW